jgi:ribosomal protein S21
MNTNVEVKKNNQESTANLLRRFTKRVQGSGMISRLRKERYYKRTKSPLVTRMEKLKKLGKKATYENLLKLGKIQETQGRRK